MVFSLKFFKSIVNVKHERHKSFSYYKYPQGPTSFFTTQETEQATQRSLKEKAVKVRLRQERICQALLVKSYIAKVTKKSYFSLLKSFHFWLSFEESNLLSY